jgi:hypothetical protein
MVLTRSTVVTPLRATKTSMLGCERRTLSGVRDIAEVTDLAQRRGFSLAETIPMPADNLSVIFERGP